MSHPPSESLGVLVPPGTTLNRHEVTWWGLFHARLDAIVTEWGGEDSAHDDGLWTTKEWIKQWKKAVESTPKSEHDKDSINEVLKYCPRSFLDPRFPSLARLKSYRVAMDFREPGDTWLAKKTEKWITRYSGLMYGSLGQKIQKRELAVGLLGQELEKYASKLAQVRSTALDQKRVFDTWVGAFTGKARSTFLEAAEVKGKVQVIAIVAACLRMVGLAHSGLGEEKVWMAPTLLVEYYLPSTYGTSSFTLSKLCELDLAKIGQEEAARRRKLNDEVARLKRKRSAEASQHHPKRPSTPMQRSSFSESDAASLPNFDVNPSASAHPHASPSSFDDSSAVRRTSQGSYSPFTVGSYEQDRPPSSVFSSPPSSVAQRGLSHSWYGNSSDGNSSGDEYTHSPTSSTFPYGVPMAPPPAFPNSSRPPISSPGDPHPPFDFGVTSTSHNARDVGGYPSHSPTSSPFTDYALHSSGAPRSAGTRTNSMLPPQAGPVRRNHGRRRLSSSHSNLGRSSMLRAAGSSTFSAPGPQSLGDLVKVVANIYHNFSNPDDGWHAMATDQLNKLVHDLKPGTANVGYMIVRQYLERLSSVKDIRDLPYIGQLPTTVAQASECNDAGTLAVPDLRPSSF